MNLRRLGPAHLDARHGVTLEFAPHRTAQQVCDMAGAIAWTIVQVAAPALIQAVLTRLDTWLLRRRPAREGAA